MKTRFLYVALAAAAVFAAPVNGQDPKSAAPQRPSINERVKMLSVALALKPDQEEEIREIYEKNEAPRKKLRGDETVNAFERKARLQELAKREQEQITAVLAPEQKPKWEELMAKRAARRAAAAEATKPKEPKEVAPAPAPKADAK